MEKTDLDPKPGEIFPPFLNFPPFFIVPAIFSLSGEQYGTNFTSSIYLTNG
jgi:hypothetical protein